MKSPKFSIITVTWNNAQGLQRTLDSIRSLDYAAKEVIIIDGASTDETPSVIERNRDIITIAVSEKDKGIYNAMNKGITHATGDYVVFMNAGDCFAASDTLSTVNTRITGTTCDAKASDAGITSDAKASDADIILGSARYGDDLRTVPQAMTLYDILSLGINHQSTYYRTEVLKRYGFDEQYRIIADLKSVVEPVARDRATVLCIPDVLSVCEGGGLSKQRWRDALAENRRIIEEVVDPFYRKDYARLARINNAMLDDFALLSHFTSVFPVIRMLAKAVRFLNDKFKHIPV